MSTQLHHVEQSTPIRVEWGGFYSDTFTLQRAGWMVSVLQNPYRSEISIALRHEQLRMEGYSQKVRVPHLRDRARYHLPDFLRGVVLRLHVLGNPVYVQDYGRDFALYQPVDTSPQWINVTTKELSQLVPFAPFVKPAEKELIVDPNQIGQVLEMIKQAQLPNQAEIRERMRTREKREGLVFEAQLYSLAG